MHEPSANGRRLAYVAIPREMFSESDPFWTEPRTFSKAEAWLDIMQLATWRPRHWSIGSTSILLARGETRPLSRSFLAVRWGWHETNVSRVLGLLLQMDRIRTGQRTAHGTTYLIVDYDVYQGRVTGDVAEGEAADGREVCRAVRPQTGRKDKQEPGNREQREQEVIVMSVQHSERTPKCDDYSEDFKTFWDRYPRSKNNSKREAFRAWQARLKQGHTAAVMIAGAERYARRVEAEGIEPRYRKHARTFLGPNLHFLDPHEPEEEPMSSLGFDDCDFD